MGQKVHPYGFRLGYTKPWRSRWFAKQGYAALLHEDLKLKASLRKRLKAAGMRTAILSNGSPKMLDAAVQSAGLADSLDAVLSVEEVGVFKPHPDVYRLGVDRLDLPAAEMAFHSANAWDAAAAAHFGYRAVWINRFGQPPERMPGTPEAEFDSLDGVADLLGIR